MIASGQADKTFVGAAENLKSVGGVGEAGESIFEAVNHQSRASDIGGDTAKLVGEKLHLMQRGEIGPEQTEFCIASGFRFFYRASYFRLQSFVFEPIGWRLCPVASFAHQRDRGNEEVTDVSQELTLEKLLVK